MKYSNKMLCDDNKNRLSGIATFYYLYGKYNTFELSNTFLEIDILKNCKLKSNGFDCCNIYLSKEALDVVEKFQKDLIETAVFLIANKHERWDDCAIDYLKQIPQLELVKDNTIESVHIINDKISHELGWKGEFYADIILSVLPLYDHIYKASWEIFPLEQ